MIVTKDQVKSNLKATFEFIFYNYTYEIGSKQFNQTYIIPQDCQNLWRMSMECKSEYYNWLFDDLVR